jgi:hypothetical protein
MRADGDRSAIWAAVVTSVVAPFAHQRRDAPGRLLIEVDETQGGGYLVLR